MGISMMGIFPMGISTTGISPMGISTMGISPTSITIISASRASIAPRMRKVKLRLLAPTTTTLTYSPFSSAQLSAS